MAKLRRKVISRWRALENPGWIYSVSFVTTCHDLLGFASSPQPTGSTRLSTATWQEVFCQKIGLRVNRMKRAASVSLDDNPRGHAALCPPYARCVGELQVLVDRLFDFGRNEGDFDDSRLTWDEFQNAYRTLGIQIEKLFVNDRMNLERFTKRALSKQD